MKKLANLRNLSRPERVMGIDASSHSFAFAIIDQGKLTTYGIIHFGDGDSDTRMRSAARIMRRCGGWFNVDLVCLEQATVGLNARVGLILAEFYGVIKGALLEHYDHVTMVYPITWHSWIKNNNPTKLQKEALKLERPGEKAGWYSNEWRSRRKEFTRQWVKSTYLVDITDDNVSDAIALTAWAWDKFGRV